VRADDESDGVHGHRLSEGKHAEEDGREEEHDGGVREGKRALSGGFRRAV
jgi:hypothetical protein